MALKPSDVVKLAKDNNVKMIVLQIGANDDPQFADTVFSCVQAWANPFARPMTRSPAVKPPWTPARNATTSAARRLPKKAMCARSATSPKTRSNRASLIVPHLSI